MHFYVRIVAGIQDGWRGAVPLVPLVESVTLPVAPGVVPGMKNVSILAVLLLLGTTVLTAASEYEPYGGFPASTEHNFVAGIEAYRLVHGAIRSGDFEAARGGAENVAEHLQRVIDAGGAAAQTAHLYLAHMYLELIVDAATWFAYQPRFDAHRTAFVAAGGNGTDLAYLDAKRMLFFPPSMGGDPEEARRVLTQLVAQGGPYEAEYFLASSYLNDGEPDSALSVLAGYPADRLSRASLDLQRRLEIEIAAPRVRSVSLESTPRTAEPLLVEAIVLTPGSTLTTEDASDTLERVGALPGISNVALDYDYDQERNEVDVRITIGEGSQRIVGGIVSSTLFTDIDRSNPATPLLLYMDENLFGRGVGLSVITAGIFNRVGVTIPVGDGIDLRTGVEAMVLPLATVEFYGANGDPLDELSFAGRHGAATIGAVTELGPAKVELDYLLRRDWYEREDDTAPGYVLPEDRLHRGALRLSVDTSEDIFFGAGLAGFRAGAAGRYDYYTGFDSWGTDEFRNDAPSNGFGSGTWEVSGAWGRRIGRRGDAGVHIAAVGGWNYYTRSLHRLGAPSGFDRSEVYVRGYPQGSIEAERALIAHAHGGAELVPGALHVSVFYDGAFVDAPDRVRQEPGMLNAAGIGLAAKLPWSLDLAVSWAHGFGSLDGSTNAPSDMFAITVTRLAAF